MVDIQNEIHQPILCYKGTKYVVFIIIKDNQAYINFLKEKEEMI